MTTKLEIRLFGKPEVAIRDSSGQRRLMKRKQPLALVAYLVLCPDPNGVNRDTLATWFEEEGKGEERARKRLNDILNKINKEASLNGFDKYLLHIDPACYGVDVHRFLELFGAFRKSDSIGKIIEYGREALRVYKGEFFDTNAKNDPEFQTPDFDTWRYFKREEYRDKYREIRNKLMESYMRLGNYEDAREIYEMNKVVYKIVDPDYMPEEDKRLDESFEKLYNSIEKLKDYEKIKREPVLNIHSDDRLFDLYAEIEDIQHALGERGKQETYLAEMVQLAVPESGNKQAILVYRRGRLAFSLGRYEQALCFARKAYQLYESLGVAEGIGKALNLSAASLARLHRYAGAMADYEEAREQFRTMGDQRGEAATIVSAAARWVRMGEFEKGEEWSQNAYNLFRQLHDERGLCTSALNLGTALMWLKRVDEAEPWYREALQHATRNKFKLQKASALVNLGTVYVEQGHLDIARNRICEGLELRRELNHPEAAGDAVCLAISYAQGQKYREACEWSEWAVDKLKSERLSGVEYPQRVHFVHAQILRILGRRDEARVALAAAKDALRDNVNRLPDEEAKARYKERFPFNQSLMAVREQDDDWGSPGIL